VPCSIQYKQLKGLDSIVLMSCRDACYYCNQEESAVALVNEVEKNGEGRIMVRDNGRIMAMYANYSGYYTKGRRVYSKMLTFAYFFRCCCYYYWTNLDQFINNKECLFVTMDVETRKKLAAVENYEQ
jgi:hypothetical protein